MKMVPFCSVLFCPVRMLLLVHIIGIHRVWATRTLWNWWKIYFSLSIFSIYFSLLAVVNFIIVHSSSSFFLSLSEMLVFCVVVSRTVRVYVYNVHAHGRCSYIHTLDASVTKQYFVMMMMMVFPSLFFSWSKNFCRYKCLFCIYEYWIFLNWHIGRVNEIACTANKLMAKTDLFSLRFVHCNIINVNIFHEWLWPMERHLLWTDKRQSKIISNVLY